MPQRFAAIDIGSNALRAVIAQESNSHIQILQNYREALRLGDDVFFTGAISNKKIEETQNCFIRLLHIFAETNVTSVKAVATSAMRGAKNSKAIIENIQKLTSINIELINGLEEARLIHLAVSTQYHMKSKIGLLIDIGGGSTEITITSGAKVLDSKSFKIGTVRLLHKYNQKEIEQKVSRQINTIKEFIKKNIKNRKIDICVGTGGNLRRIGKLRKRILYQASSKFASAKDVHIIYQLLTNLSFEERMQKLQMRPDRADVIIPATFIISQLMDSLNIENINLPRVGLKEGVLLDLINPKANGFILL